MHEESERLPNTAEQQSSFGGAEALEGTAKWQAHIDYIYHYYETYFFGEEAAEGSKALAERTLTDLDISEEEFFGIFMRDIHQAAEESGQDAALLDFRPPSERERDSAARLN